MAYDSDTETFYQDQSTVIDSTPDGDTVKEGFEDRLTPAMAAVYSDFNLLKVAGMIGVGVPATETARGIGRMATAAEVAAKKTGGNGPAFLTPENAPSVPLNNTVTSTSTTEAATANAVKQAYDKANSALSTASSAANTASYAAPKPSSYSGVGQMWASGWNGCNGTGWPSGTFIPSGGTWCCFVLGMCSNGTMGQAAVYFLSGGSNMKSYLPTASNSSVWWCWRIS